MSVIMDYYKDLMYNRNGTLFFYCYSAGGTFLMGMYFLTDPRTQNWFLISSPGPLLMIVFSYLYFSVSLGPRIMKNRKPFDLRSILIIYNFIQVLFSIYMVSEGLQAGWLNDYSFTCQPVDYSNNAQALRMARAVYFYFACKVIELLDTVFFVLRKKQRQISFLHLYHHAMMPICAWIGVRFVPGGHATLLGLINAFIHVLMYTYYMLSAFGPEIQRYLWWKKYLTSLQLVQFSIIFVHNLQVLVTDCNFPKPLSFLLCVNAALFIYLFGSFYVKTYNVEKRQGKDKKLEDDSKLHNGNGLNGHATKNGYSNNSISNGYSKPSDKSD